MLEFLRAGIRKAIPQGLGAGGPRFRIKPDVKASTHAGGIVLLDLGGNRVYSANRVGAMVWSGVAAHANLPQIAESVSREFRVPLEMASADTREFVAQLTSQGLLVPESD